MRHLQHYPTGDGADLAFRILFFFLLSPLFFQCLFGLLLRRFFCILTLSHKSLLICSGTLRWLDSIRASATKAGFGSLFNQLKPGVPAHSRLYS